MANKKQRFSQIDLRSALQIIGINELKEWQIKFTPKQASEYYLTSTQKLKAHFDLSLSESAKSLLIDAILLEAIDSYAALKIWKEAKLQTEQLTGVVDYLIAGQGKVYQSPLLCIVEAKKDDFEQGLAQCLTEMYACLTLNQPQYSFPIYGIVTNATTWRFYQLNKQECYESLAYSETQLKDILGILNCLFADCQAKLLNHSQSGNANLAR
ncbi:hypothetical protein [Pseudanabaena minima]|uniref:hypothetical protein n=1 Tax=Pseudanabaena minima TaxID=890415 RepID=UPI003DA9D7FA